MKKKGFTLVELLAVIVILAIIALIAIPLIGNVIEKAKIGSLESSVNGLVESANMYYANNTIKGETISETIFDFEDGEQVSDKKLEYKGKVYNGKLILHANGEVAVCIDDEEHYAYKNKDIDEIVSGVGTCLYDGTTGDFSSNSSINDLRGKTLVATDISQSEDGLSTLITIPEEGHYDRTSKISVLNSQLNNNQTYIGSSNLAFDFGATVSASSVFSDSYLATYAINGNIGNTWLSSTTSAEIVIDLKSTKKIIDILFHLTHYNGGDGNLADATVKGYYSIDGTSFTEYFSTNLSVSGYAGRGTPLLTQLGQNARYIKLQISSSSGAGLRNVYMTVIQ